MAMHCIDSEIAVKVGGAAEAVICADFFWAILEKERLGYDFHNGKYWVRTSIKELEKYFTYLSFNQIRTVLEKLRAGGFLKVNNYNEDPFDKTLWYALGEAGEPIYEEWKSSSIRVSNSRRKN